MLLALSANSPFSQGRDSGFASARTVIFQGFPRTGTARRFADYTDYVEAVDPLIASGALPDPSFLWWDVRLQPPLGTVEVRVMDAQSSVADSAPLIALVQSLAPLMLEGEPPNGATAPEILAENRFLAARDGLQAKLDRPREARARPDHNDRGRPPGAMPSTRRRARLPRRARPDQTPGRGQRSGSPTRTGARGRARRPGHDARAALHHAGSTDRGNWTSLRTMGPDRPRARGAGSARS